jgi:MarR-like DNA-binding transcriptional regulator SgrR of sgrS sRNA
MSLTLGLLTDDLRLDAVDTAVCAVPVIAPLYQPLLHIDRCGEAPAPDLAEHWEIAADGCSYRFWLREARFHDGEPVQVRDMAWSLSRHLWPSSASLFGPVLRGLLQRGGTTQDGEIAESFEVDGTGRCLTIRLAAPYVPLPALLANPMLGVVRETADGVIGSGPLAAQRLGESSWQLDLHVGYRGPRVARRELRLVGYDTPQALHMALAGRQVDAVSVERLHQPMFADHFASTPLKDRWVGALMVNAGGTLHSTPMRRDFGQMVQGLASGLFGASFEPFLLPEGLARPTYRQRPLAVVAPSVFAARWRQALIERPLRIVYCPGRGPLSEILTTLAETLAQQGVAHHVIEVAEPAGVYRLVAQGAFDVVARGWAQDFDDADEFFGIYDKQAPGALANLPVQRLQARVSAARHLLSAEERSNAYEAALIELEAQWLCVPICRDWKRLFHHPGLRLRAGCQDVFSPVEESAVRPPAAAASLA